MHCVSYRLLSLVGLKERGLSFCLKRGKSPGPSPVCQCGAAVETGLFPRWRRRGQELSGELVCKKGQLNGELCKERCDYIVNSCKLVFACLLVDFG